jgi:hypothetical protein
MSGIKKTAVQRRQPPPKLEKAAQDANARGILSDKGVQALTDGDISYEDKQMATDVLNTAFDKAGAAGAEQNVAKLEPAVRNAEVAKQLADETTKQFYKENPSMGAKMMSKLGGFIDAQTLGMHQATLKNLGGQ